MEYYGQRSRACNKYSYVDSEIVNNYKAMIDLVLEYQRCICKQCQAYSTNASTFEAGRPHSGWSVAETW